MDSQGIERALLGDVGTRQWKTSKRRRLSRLRKEETCLYLCLLARCTTCTVYHDFLFDAPGLKSDEARGIGAIVIVVTPLITIMKAMLTGNGVPAIHRALCVDDLTEVALRAPRCDQKYAIMISNVRIADRVKHSNVTRGVCTIPQTLSLSLCRRGWPARLHPTLGTAQLPVRSSAQPWRAQEKLLRVFWWRQSTVVLSWSMIR